MRYPPVFPGWLHAFVMQYQMLPSFIFGFLLTTFPKWTKLPDVAPRRFVPVGIALVAGQLVTLAGALGSHAAIVAREYGIPGIVGTREATAKIVDGARVRVDGSTGEVRVLV